MRSQKGLTLPQSKVFLPGSLGGVCCSNYHHNGSPSNPNPLRISSFCDFYRLLILFVFLSIDLVLLNFQTSLLKCMEFFRTVVAHLIYN